MNFFTTVQGPSLIISSEFRCGHTFCSSKTPLSKVWRILLHFYHRLWTTTTHPPDPNSPGHVRAQRIGYHDIMPARLESNPDAFGPKYESLSDAMKSFNQKLKNGEEEISGNLQSGIHKTHNYVSNLAHRYFFNCLHQNSSYMDKSHCFCGNFSFFQMHFSILHDFQNRTHVDLVPSYIGFPPLALASSWFFIHFVSVTFNLLKLCIHNSVVGLNCGLEYVAESAFLQILYIC